MRACSLVDTCVKELLDVVEDLGGRWLVTADHGNADDMVQRNKKDSSPIQVDGKLALLTSHTLVSHTQPECICGSGNDLVFYPGAQGERISGGSRVVPDCMPPLEDKIRYPTRHGSYFRSRVSHISPLVELTLQQHTPKNEQCLQAPVLVAIGGSGLPEDVKFREDLPKAGLANITGTYINLLGYATPSHMEPSLMA